MKHSSLRVMDSPRMMAGKGAPQDTLFGVIGKTMMESENRVLGGLVKDTKTKGAPTPDTIKGRIAPETENSIGGSPSKTTIAKAHYGQTLYAGKFMGMAGARLS